MKLNMMKGIKSSQATSRVSSGEKPLLPERILSSSVTMKASSHI
jgi:hypothetical protein